MPPSASLQVEFRLAKTHRFRRIHPARVRDSRVGGPSAAAAHRWSLQDGDRCPLRLAHSPPRVYACTPSSSERFDPRWTPNRPLIDTSKTGHFLTLSAETLTAARSLCSSIAMGNVLDLSKQQQVIALGRLGWPLRRIEQETGVRRETASAYLRAAGIAVRGRGRPGGRRENRPFSPRCPPTPRNGGRGLVARPAPVPARPTDGACAQPNSSRHNWEIRRSLRVDANKSGGPRTGRFRTSEGLGRHTGRPCGSRIRVSSAQGEDELVSPPLTRGTAVRSATARYNRACCRASSTPTPSAS